MRVQTLTPNFYSSGLSQWWGLGVPKSSDLLPIISHPIGCFLSREFNCFGTSSQCLSIFGHSQHPTASSGAWSTLEAAKNTNPTDHVQTKKGAVRQHEGAIVGILGIWWQIGTHKLLGQEARHVRSVCQCVCWFCGRLRNATHQPSQFSVYLYVVSPVRLIFWGHATDQTVSNSISGMAWPSLRPVCGGVCSTDLRWSLWLWNRSSAHQGWDGPAVWDHVRPDFTCGSSMILRLALCEVTGWYRVIPRWNSL